ncbi:hypothetical protein ACA910_007891 [Epithemia clementina (nom. ined.)]
MSEASERRMIDYIRRFKRGDKRIHEQWTMYPNGEKITVNESCCGIYIGFDHMAILSECELGHLKNEVDQASLRGVEMLRHLPVAVTQFDIGGKLMDQNPEALDLFGGLEDSVIEEKFVYTTRVELHSSNSFECRFVDRELGRRVLKTVQKGEDYQTEAQQYTINRGIRWFAIKVRRSRDPVSEAPVILYSARDITEVVEAKNEADQANMDKSEMLAVLAHEIRTPLHQAVGFIELLAQTPLSSEQTDFVQSLQSSAVSLMTIINDVLDYTRLEARKVEIEQIPFDPRGVCNGCVEILRPIAEKKGLCLQFQCQHPPAPLNRVMGDPNRIRQILLNLLSNAAKFTPRGSISIALNFIQTREHPSKHFLEFIVADTGVGISAENLEVIFKKYKPHVNVAVPRHSGGTGLGLSICKALADAMNGSLTVKSQLNVGSEFILRVPVEVDSIHVVEMDESDGNLEPAPNCRIRILVAEDNKMNQKLVNAMLKRANCEDVTIVENGQLAINELEKHPRDHFHLVFMDVQMPVMDGIEATRQIRRRGWTMDILPIIGLTANYQTPELQRYEDLGMNDCFGKPVRLETLRNAVEHVQRRQMGIKANSSS